MKHIEIEQNSEEWDNIRLGKFTASMFYKLFSKKDSATYQKAILNIAYERATGESEEKYTSKLMQRGHDREPFAAFEYETQTFRETKKVGFYQYNDFIGASPDRAIVGLKGGCEFKCPTFSVYHEYLLNGLIPDIYYYQIQGQLLCTNWDFIAYMPFTSTKVKNRITTVERSDKDIKLLIEALFEANYKVEKILNDILS